MKRIILCFIIFLFSASAVYAEELPKVRIGYPMGLQNASMIINRGWDKENGFEIEPVRFSGTSTIVQGMFRGDIDLVIIAPTVIQTANNQGGQFRVIGATMINATDMYAVGDFATQYDDTKSAEETLKINFGYIPMMYSTPFFVMVEKGILKEYIDVNDIVDTSFYKNLQEG